MAVHWGPPVSATSRSTVCTPVSCACICCVTSPAVASTFHAGRGRVLHTLGHYYQEAGNLAGTNSVHRLALNFVLMRLDQDRKAGKK